MCARLGGSNRMQKKLRDIANEDELRVLMESEKLAAVVRLAASMAHEINNPLTSVTNLLYLVGASSTLQESQDHARLALSEIARVSEIVAQSLRFHGQQS